MFRALSLEEKTEKKLRPKPWVGGSKMLLPSYCATFESGS
jgi:hypothetical protein